MNPNQHDIQRLITRQLALEEEALQEGARLFLQKIQRAMQAGRATAMGAAKEALDRVSERVTAGLDATVADLSPEDECIVRAVHDVTQGITLGLDEASSSPGRPAVALRYIREAGSAFCAYVTVKCVLDGVGQEQASQRFIAKQIADLLEDERILVAFKAHLATNGTAERPGEDATKFFEFAMQRASKHHRHEGRMYSLYQAMKFSGFDPEPHRLPPAHSLALGMTLLALGEQYGGLWTTEYETRAVRGSMQTLRTVRLTEVAQRAIEQRNQRLAIMHPLLLPMVAEPAPWGVNERGGYLGVLSSRHSLVRRASKAEQAEIESQELPAVYEALNRLQSTPFTINRRVLQVAEWAWFTRNGGIAGLPSMSDPPRPSRPSWADETTDPKTLSGTDEQEWREWKRSVAAWHDLCREMVSRRIATRQTIHTAKRFSDESAIYFPWNIDFRGRTYPIPTSLSPQGPDLHRGLLYFANATVVDQRALYWLAVHGANCLEVTHDGQKLTKMTFDERASYILSRTKDILAVAEDPMGNLWWSRAEEPWQFLAFCFEWAEAGKAMREGREFRSGLIVALDGTCNGLQHYAALLRDETAAQAVNVLPTDRPQDIYAAVASATERHLTAMTEGSDETNADLARRALSAGLASRKVAKRPTMTLPYGSGEYGFRAQIEETIHADFAEAIGPYLTYDRTGDRVFPVSVLLAGSIHAALAFVVRSAVECMDWFQAWASIASRAGKPFEWTVPHTGLRVRQRYVKEDEHVQHYHVLGKRHRVTLRTPTTEIDSHRARNASAPNIIHSLDAAVMHQTVVDSATKGVRSWSMIHDSYATTPGEMERLWETIRATFSAFYAADLLAHFEAQWIERYQPDPKEIPARPEMGQLDPSEIAQSLYLFC